jgi:hypothetical protein
LAQARRGVQVQGTTISRSGIVVAHQRSLPRAISELKALVTYLNMWRRPSVRRAARCSGTALALLLPASTSHAQVAYDSPKGRVEVLGLKRWTLKMLQDSVRHYVPGQELYDHACMVTLRDSLHFADASVDNYFTTPPGGKPSVFLSIKVIEPQDSARVQWNARKRSDYSSLLPDYAPLVLAISDSNGTPSQGRFLQWLQFYQRDSVMRAAILDRLSSSAFEREDAARLWKFLNARRTESDRRRAMRVLETNGLFANRMVASAILSNFAAHDSTWWTLVRELRDPHQAVRNVASDVLKHLPPRPVDWTPVSADLRLLLGGTNLPAMGIVIDLLDRTAVKPELSSQLLHHNADWLLSTLASENPEDHPAAHRLLVRFNHGVDLGSARANWTRWASSL